MTARSWIRKLFDRKPRTIRNDRVRSRPRLETLEDRTLLNNPAADGLLSTIQNNNIAGSSMTITLAPNTTYDFTSASDNNLSGPSALPVIHADITIVGSTGDIIERTGTTPFRLFGVAFHGSLDLQNLTLQGGLAQGNSFTADGGAIYSAGTLTLSNVTVKSNQAVGSNGSNPTPAGAPGFNGASASGGGVYVAGGTVSLTNDIFSGNQALGGAGRKGGNGNAGRNGTTGSLFTGYKKMTGGAGGPGGAGGNGGAGYGGGLYVGGGA
jgi:predicted outer membrane repeat protein